jgi:hypothetical protein
MAKALSLHVGVSGNNGHAGSGVGTAPGCATAAARLHEQLAVAGGYAHSVVLRDLDATLANVEREFAALTAAGTLEAGDLFVVTVAAHGVELGGPGSGCEPHDQAIVLYDNYLVDNALYQLCSGVGVAADIVIVAEGCLTGSIHLAPVVDAFFGVTAARARIGSRVRTAGSPCPERPLLTANVLMLAATSAVRLAMGTLIGGVPPFTAALLEEMGASADYIALKAAIDRRLAGRGSEPCVLDTALVHPASDLVSRRPFLP